MGTIPPVWPKRWHVMNNLSWSLVVWRDGLTHNDHRRVGDTRYSLHKGQKTSTHIHTKWQLQWIAEQKSGIHQISFSWTTKIHHCFAFEFFCFRSSAGKTHMSQALLRRSVSGSLLLLHPLRAPNFDRKRSKPGGFHPIIRFWSAY